MRVSSYIENIQERRDEEIEIGFQEESREGAPEYRVNSFRLAFLCPVTLTEELGEYEREEER